MKNTKLLMAACTAALLFCGCDVNDPINNTVHPHQGKITVTADWTKIGTDLTNPIGYTVAIDNYTEQISSKSHTLNNLFDPGDYRLYAYNTADNITVSGTTATADYSSGTPGWFFTCAMDVRIEADKVHPYTTVMNRQMRQLTLIIEPTGGSADRIRSITGILSDVARSYDINSGTHASATDVPLTFTQIESGTDAGKWTVTVRLLGFTGNGQKLTGTITFTDGTPGDLPIDSDLSAALAEFNNNKTEPLTLSAETETQYPAGLTATITEWTAITGGTGIAD